MKLFRHWGYGTRGIVKTAGKLQSHTPSVAIGQQTHYGKLTGRWYTSDRLWARYIADILQLGKCGRIHTTTTDSYSPKWSKWRTEPNIDKHKKKCVSSVWKTYKSTDSFCPDTRTKRLDFSDSRPFFHSGFSMRKSVYFVKTTGAARGWSGSGRQRWHDGPRPPWIWLCTHICVVENYLDN